MLNISDTDPCPHFVRPILTYLFWPVRSGAWFAYGGSGVLYLYIPTTFLCISATILKGIAKQYFIPCLMQRKYCLFVWIMLMFKLIFSVIICKYIPIFIDYKLPGQVYVWVKVLEVVHFLCPHKVIESYRAQVVPLKYLNQ